MSLRSVLSILTEQRGVRGGESMVNQYMTCPFSKGKCIQCAIYRGRHAEICFASGYHGGEFKNLMEKKTKPRNGCTDAKVEFPDLKDTSSKWLKDVENCVID
jgi:hypothetical protein